MRRLPHRASYKRAEDGIAGRLRQVHRLQEVLRLGVPLRCAREFDEERQVMTRIALRRPRLRRTPCRRRTASRPA